VSNNLQTEKNKIELLTEYQNVTQKVLFYSVILNSMICGRKYDVMPKNGDFKRSIIVCFGFLKQSPFSKCNVAIELNMGKMYFQIMLPDFGYSNFKILVLLLLRSKQLYSKCWRTLGGKLDLTRKERRAC
jgi:hypothetical protein